MAQAETTQKLEIPDFETFIKTRQAVVNDKKEKKRGGLPWWPNLAATRGMGVGAQIGAAFASKIGFLTFFALIGTVAAGGGLWQQARVRAQQDTLKSKQFNMAILRDHIIRQNEELKIAKPKVDHVRNDTLGFVYRGEGLDNPNASVDAAKAAAEAAAKAEADKVKEGDKAKEPGSPDPNAMAAAMMQQAQGTRDGAGAPGAAGARAASRLGAGFGALKGGAGMSGGVGRGFDNLNMRNSTLGKGDGLRASAAAGLGSNPLGKGAPRNWQAARNVTSGARSAIDANRLRGMQGLMAANRSGDVTKAAAANSQAWDASAAPGQSIQGAGAAIPGAAGPSGSAPEATAAPEGGPMDVSSGNNPDISTANVPDIPGYQDAVPYQWAITIAKMLMAAIFLVSLYILAAKAFPTIASPGIIAACETAIAIMGGLLAVLGLYMISMQQYLQGTIWTVLGAGVAILALAAPVTAGVAVPLIQGYAGATVAALGAAGGFIGQTAGIDPANEQASKDDYQKKYGVNPDTNQVDPKNQAAFDDQYGKGAAENWNKSHQKYNYTAG